MANIATALRHTGVRVAQTTLRRFSIATALSMLLRSHIWRNEVIYVSYPTEGYGKSLLPFLLAFGDRRQIVLHVHEYSSKNRYCRFLLRRFQRMERLFFSNSEDHQRYVADCGLTADSPKVEGWRVMPTPSNIPVTASEGLRSPSRVRVVHFGQIRPLKGLEDLVEVMGSLSDETLDRVVVGGVPKGYEDYARDLSERLACVGVKVKLNLTPEQISQELASAHVGLFAFLDGADERRGSLIAAMSHGVLCVTTHSDRTPKQLKDATIGVQIQDGSSAGQLAAALRQAIAEVDSSDNLQRIRLSRQIGAKASFHGIVEQLLHA